MNVVLFMPLITHPHLMGTSLPSPNGLLAAPVDTLKGVRRLSGSCCTAAVSSVRHACKAKHDKHTVRSSGSRAGARGGDHGGTRSGRCSHSTSADDDELDDGDAACTFSKYDPRIVAKLSSVLHIRRSSPVVHTRRFGCMKDVADDISSGYAGLQATRVCQQFPKRMEERHACTHAERELFYLSRYTESALTS